MIDDWGRTPLPYAENGETIYPTAYQQILKGYPAVDYSVRDLLYRPRNIRVDRAYGFGPVEQIVTTVNIALRRQAFLLDYFTQGNIPDSLIGVPENWTPDQIASYQKYWDAYFDGDLGRRRRAKFVPGGVAKTFVQIREPDLKGPFDEGSLRNAVFLAHLNSGNVAAVPHVMLEFDTVAGRVLSALVRRRKAEASMFEGRYPTRARLLRMTPAASRGLRKLLSMTALSNLRLLR